VDGNPEKSKGIHGNQSRSKEERANRVKRVTPEQTKEDCTTSGKLSDSTLMRGKCPTASPSNQNGRPKAAKTYNPAEGVVEDRLKIYKRENNRE